MSYFINTENIDLIELSCYIISYYIDTLNHNLFHFIVLNYTKTKTHKVNILYILIILIKMKDNNIICQMYYIRNNEIQCKVYNC